MISVVLPPGEDGPDTSSLPAGTKVTGSVVQADGSYRCTVSGEPDATALAGLGAAVDPLSQAIRALHRHSFERINELARHVGRDDLVFTEAEALARVAQMLRDGGGLPEPPEPEES